MPRGGSRLNAGRKPDPNSARQKKLAARAEKAALGRGLTMPDGTKSPEAPEGWPFGTEAPAQPPAAAQVVAEVDKDADDGLTDAERAGLSPLEYLLAIMRSPEASKSARMQAAIQAAPYVHARVAPAAKKDAKKDAATKAAGGRFAAAAAPLKLVPRA